MAWIVPGKEGSGHEIITACSLGWESFGMPLVGSDRWRHFLLVDYAGENLFWADKDLRRLWFALLFCLSIPFHLCAWFISWNVQNNKRAYSPPCLWVVIVDPAVFSSKALEAGATIAREVLEMTSAQLKEKNRTLSNYLFNYLSNAWCSKMSRKPRTKGRMSVQV